MFITFGSIGLFTGCSVTKTYKATYTHIHDFPTYQSRMLPVDKPSGKLRLQQEIDYDVVVKSYVKDYGNPDYIYVESRYKIYAFYRSPEKFVTFTRSIFKPQAADVKEVWAIPQMYKKKMPPLEPTQKGTIALPTIKAVSPETNKAPLPKPKVLNKKTVSTEETASQDGMSQRSKEIAAPKIDETSSLNSMTAKSVTKKGRNIKKVPEQGDAEAQYNLGVRYAHGQGVPQNYNEAFKLFKKAAEQGHALAQHGIGAMYINGSGVQQNNTKAFEWYRKAATQGNANSQIVVGIMHAHGQGVPQNYDEAAKWYRKAAKQGHALALLCLGTMYTNGSGVPQDYKQAAYYYRKAAEQGDAEAQYVFGSMHVRGQGVPQNYDEAAKWYQKAAKQGHARAQSDLGFIYGQGQGVTRDYNMAAKWSRKAAEQGYAPAQYNMGFIYSTGQGVRQSHTDAFNWYTKAANQGNPHAQCNLGVAYANGQGVPIDFVKAYAWLSLSATQGLDDSNKPLSMCAERMTSKQIAKAKIMAKKLWNTINK